MRVYLKQGSHIVRVDAVPGKNSLHYKAFGEVVFDEGTRPYINLSVQMPFVPKLEQGLLEVAELFSWEETLPNGTNNRTAGEYYWKTAKAVVTKGHYNDRNFTVRVDLHIEGPDLADIAELFTLVCGGKLHPTVSYEEKTVPAPARHISQLFREIGEIVRRDMTVWWTKKTLRFRRA